MPKKSVPASVRETAFDCPYCGAYTSQTWLNLHATKVKDDPGTPSIIDETRRNEIAEDQTIPPEMRQKFVAFAAKMASGKIFLEPYNAGGSRSHYNDIENLYLSKCYVCGEIAVWVYDNLVFPPERHGASPNVDLPEDVLADYEEARSILNLSPRGAAALLRLAIQKLCIFLGEKGKNIDSDIANLVAKGLNPLVQKSLDVVRVVGNEAVHPGVIDLKDDRDTATKLFTVVNIIAEQMISHPKHVDEMYGSLPDTKREAIAKRDGKSGSESNGSA